MSLWRKEASARLPELQAVIASRNIDNPMMLWIELQTKFQMLCEEQPPDIELVQRIWDYAKWCMQQDNQDLATAAALGFCEHLLDSKSMQHLLPKIMSRSDYRSLKELLLYHNSEQKFEEGLKGFAANVL